MKTKGIMLLVAWFLTSVIVFGGCKKKEEPAEPPHEHEHEAAAITEEAVSAAAQIEQKICPVMPEMKINPDVFTEYKGKKVYFCCPACKPGFEKEPEKYIANLPQFEN